jgi:kinetochore protein NDC80
MSTVRRSVSNTGFASASTNRQSLAPGSLFGQQTPGSASIQRRSSIYSRPSNNGPSSHQSFFTQQPAPAGIPKDPRPLKERSFQARMGQELSDYLTHNNFELEMKHSLGPNAMKSPTTKDFNLMFQWLYRRIDPGYKFQKSLDTEIPPILRQLRYPFANAITKSMIVSAGGQNSWFTFLAMLHWMMQLAQMLDRFCMGAYDEACAEAGVDVSGDRIVFRFLFGAYQDWLQVGPEDDDDSAEEALVPHVQAMAAEFERTNAKYAEELKMYEAENAALKAQVEEFEKNAPDVAKLDKHFKILEDDKKKFEDYNANVQAKIEKYNSRIKVLEEEISKTDVELQTSEQDRLTLQQSVDRQGLNIQDIDRMNTERERLQKSLDDTVTALDEVNRRVSDKETETARKLEELEAIVKRYNSLGYQMSLIPPTASNAKGASYELSLNIADTANGFSSSTSQFGTSQSGSRRRSPDTDRLLVDTNIGHSPANILNLDLRGTIRQVFISLRKEINERRKAAQETDLNARDILDSVGEALSEKHTEVDTLSHRVHLAQQAHTELRESTATAHTQTTAQIEKLEKELARMREGVERGVMELEQREMEVGVAWEGMREEAGRVREQLHAGVERALEEVIRFKVHVQKGLEEFEGWVGDEVEAELVGDGSVGVGEDGMDGERGEVFD